MQVLAKFGYAYAAFLLFASLVGAGNLVWCFPALLLLLTAGVCLKRLRNHTLYWCVLSAAVLALASFFLYTLFVYRPVAELDGKTAELRASVEDITDWGSYKSYELSVSDVDGTPVRPFGVLLYSWNDDGGITYGDRITVRASLSLNEPAEGTVLSDYYKSHGLFLSTDTVEQTVVEPGAAYNLVSAVRGFRDVLIDALYDAMPADRADVVSGMLLGGTTNLDDAQKVTFSRAGVNHLFSVSGLHLSVVVQLLMVLLFFFRIGKRGSAVAGIVAVLGFMALSGFTASVMRSGIMMLLLLFGLLVRRHSSGLNSLGLACLFLSLSNPYIMYDVGFLLSVSATLGILLFQGPLHWRLCRRLDITSRLGKELASLFTVSVSAVAGTLPVTVLAFEEVSLVGLVLNPVVNAFVTIVMLFGFVTAFLGFIPLLAPAAMVSGAVCSWAVNAIARGAELAVKLPFAYIPVGGRSVKIGFLVVLVITGVCCLFRRRRKKLLLTVVPVSLLFVVLMAGANRYVTDHSLTVTTVCTGDSSAVLIESGGVNIVYGTDDTSTGTALRRLLMGKGIRAVDLYIQPGTGRRPNRVTERLNAIVPVRRLALDVQNIVTRSVTASVPEEDMLPLTDISLEYPDGTELRVIGVEDPVLEITRNGRRVLVALDVKSTLEVQGGSALDLTVAQTATCNPGRSAAKEVLLLTPTEENDPGDERIAAVYQSYTTVRRFPDWEAAGA